MHTRKIIKSHGKVTNQILKTMKVAVHNIIAKEALLHIRERK